MIYDLIFELSSTSSKYKYILFVLVSYLSVWRALCHIGISAIQTAWPMGKAVLFTFRISERKNLNTFLWQMKTDGVVDHEKQNVTIMGFGYLAE